MCVNNGIINLFADDTVLTITMTNVNDGIEKLNDDVGMHV